MNLESVKEKVVAFNWDVIEINGHDMDAISKSFDKAMQNKTKPTFVIAHTIKGKGVNFMESVPSWHGSVKIKVNELSEALRQLNANQEEIEETIECYAKLQP